MILFEEVEAQAALHQGCVAQLREKLTSPKSASQLREMTDDRYLSALTKIIFQLGFRWSIIENKWQSFEAAFGEFNLDHCQMLSEEQLESQMMSGTIIKNWAKVRSIPSNAV
ncbi:MAG: DNA-3-methyladenine glycosylase I [Pseudomonadales bacterium]|nr:DNA-3-methyladenine glycosylase I [Pseudomonadales bacterium]